MAKKSASWVGDTPTFSSIKLAAGKTAAKMEAALDDQHHLQFVVKWTKSRPLALMSLQIGIGDKPAKEVLETPLGGNSGEVVADMGVFAGAAADAEANGLEVIVLRYECL